MVECNQELLFEFTNVDTKHNDSRVYMEYFKEGEVFGIKYACYNCKKNHIIMNKQNKIHWVEFAGGYYKFKEHICA